MGHDFRYFRWFHAVIEREVEVLRQLGGLITCDQRGERYNAAITDAKAGALPQVTEKRFLPVFFKCRRYRKHISTRLSWIS